MYDYEVSVQLPDMSHLCQHVPPAATALRRHGNHQPTVRPQPLELKLCW